MTDMRIFKYQVDFCSTLRLPVDATLLKVATQDGVTNMWALVDADKRGEDRTIHVYGTGHALPDNIIYADHIDSWIDGPYVWHAFDFTPVVEQ